MDIRNYSWQQCFAYLYVAFAQLSDGEYHPAEMENILEKVKRWGGGETDPDEFEKVMNEVIAWYASNRDPVVRVETVSQIARQLCHEEWFGVNNKMLVTGDLINIAMADNRFFDTEKDWITLIAKTWGVEVEI